MLRGVAPSSGMVRAQFDELMGRDDVVGGDSAKAAFIARPAVGTAVAPALAELPWQTEAGRAAAAGSRGGQGNLAFSSY